MRQPLITQPPSRKPGLDDAAVLLAVLVMVFTHRGWGFEPLVNDLDPGWQVGLIHARWHQLSFGLDFIFTYGPHGHLACNFVPLAVERVVLLSLTTLLLGSCLGFTLRAVLDSGWRAAGALLLIWLAAQCDPFAPVLILAPALLAWFGMPSDPDARGQDRPLHWLLYAGVFVLGLAALVKHTFLVQAGMTTLIAGLRWPRWRALLSVWLTGALGGLCWWLAARQSPLDLGTYLYASMQIISGYDAMSLPMLTAMQIPIVGAWALMLSTVTLALGWRQHRWRALLPALAVMGYGFLLFKLGLVRNDGHILTASAGLLGMSLMVAMLGLDRQVSRRGSAAALTVVLTGSLGAHVLLHWQHDQVVGPERGGSVLATVVRMRMGLAAQLRQAVTWPVAWRDRDLQWDQQLAAIRVQTPLPELPGRVDVMGDRDQVLAFAGAVDYTPRPVPQSYSAYTPWLQQQNMAFFSGHSAPENVLMRFWAIDLRWPSLSDAPCWPVLMSRYDPSDLLADKTLLHLRRRLMPRAIEATDHGTVQAAWGQWITVPATDPGSLVMAKVDMPLTRIGRAGRLLYRSPLVRIEVQTASGPLARRFIPSMGQEGFLLSPYVRSATDFLHAGWSPPDSDFRQKRQVTQVRFLIIDETMPASCYEQEFHVTFESLRPGS
jgi:hypothetical protein